MGLHKPSRTGGVFLNITDGNLVRKSKTPQDGFEEYTTINPQTGEPVKYYVERFANLDGYLVHLERVDKPDLHIYGWKLHLLDDAEYLIDFKEDAVTTRRMQCVLRNIDLDKMVNIKVFKDKDGYNAIMFEQDGVNIAQHWNKENLPEPVQRRGKWDYTERADFLYNDTLEYAKVINEAGEARLNAYRAQVTAEVQAGIREEDRDPNDPLFTGPDVTQEAPENVGKDDSIPW